MEIKLLDWNKKETIVEIGDLDDIAKMEIDVISGDEILTVVYKDYTIRKFDSSCDRMADFYDYGYEIYDFNNSENRIDDPKFLNRTDSYWIERELW